MSLVRRLQSDEVINRDAFGMELVTLLVGAYERRDVAVNARIQVKTFVDANWCWALHTGSNVTERIVRDTSRKVPVRTFPETARHETQNSQQRCGSFAHWRNINTITREWSSHARAFTTT